MLAPEQFEQMAALLRSGAEKAEIKAPAAELRQALNVPQLHGELLEGMQHKYRETVLFFPSQGQTCHSYCTFCFRWAQFVGDKSLRISSHEAKSLHHYLKSHYDVTDLLITGGDPMVMKTKHLVDYLKPLLAPEFDHVQTIRIGTKALSFWPQRFVSDGDADELLALLAELSDAGKHVAHFNHWRELEPRLRARRYAVFARAER